MNNKKIEIPKENSLLDKLYRYSQSKLENLGFPTSSTAESRFNELNHFRTEMDWNNSAPHQKPYHSKKLVSSAYRTIFIGLGVLFAVLSLILTTQSYNWTCQLVFGNCFLARVFLSSTAIVFALLSFWMSYAIRTEREAAFCSIRKAQKKLTSLYAQGKAKLNLVDLFSPKQLRAKSASYKQTYKRTQEKIREQGQFTLDLLNKISYSSSQSNEQKELLFNQAILEMECTFAHIHHDFKNTKI